MFPSNKVKKQTKKIYPGSYFRHKFLVKPVPFLVHRVPQIELAIYMPVSDGAKSTYSANLFRKSAYPVQRYVFCFVVVGTSLGLNYNSDFPTFQISISGSKFKKMGNPVVKNRGNYADSKGYTDTCTNWLDIWLKCAIIKCKYAIG